MLKKSLLLLAVATALFAGFLLGHTLLQNQSTFTVSGRVETDLLDSSAADVPNRGRINVNTATEIELTDLPGIGPARAQDIAAHREAYGLFESVDDLIVIRGIGERTLERLRPFVYVE